MDAAKGKRAATVAGVVSTCRSLDRQQASRASETHKSQRDRASTAPINHDMSAEPEEISPAQRSLPAAPRRDGDGAESALTS